jgi:hypothetical protein
MKRKDTLTALVALAFLCALTPSASAGGTWDSERGYIVDDGSSHGLGPFEVTSMTIGETTIHYPVGIESSTHTFPIIGWGNGMGTSGGEAYPEYFTQLVSHGMVVAASHSAAVSGELILASVQVALDENGDPGSPLFQKLAPQFGVMGKSFGGMAAAEAVQLSSNAIAAVMIAGSRTGLTDPGLFVTGTGDFLNAMVANGYAAASGPAIFAELQGAGHMDLSHSREAAELATSFLRFHLNSDAVARSHITSPDSQQANWATYEVKNYPAWPDLWAGFEVTPDGWVDTGNWMGWLYVGSAPWVWNLHLETWMYLPEESVREYGAWAYILRP